MRILFLVLLLTLAGCSMHGRGGCCGKCPNKDNCCAAKAACASCEAGKCGEGAKCSAKTDGTTDSGRCGKAA